MSISREDLTSADITPSVVRGTGDSRIQDRLSPTITCSVYFRFLESITIPDTLFFLGEWSTYVIPIKYVKTLQEGTMFIR